MRILAIIFLCLACGAPPDAQLDNAIYEAHYHLSSLNCAKAKESLDSIDYKADSAEYVSLYSAYYACLSGYTVLGTVFENIVNIIATADGFLASMAAFSSSNETQADSAVYTNLKLAISEIIIRGGNTVARTAKYGTVKGQDLSFQLLYMVTTEFGKYLAYYGNAGATGDKGGGATAGHNCLMNYDLAGVVPILSLNNADTCTTTAEGSSDLDPTDDSFIARACEGIVLFNNFGDIVSNITFSDSDQMGDLEDTGSLISQGVAAATLIEPAVDDYKDFVSFAACEAHAEADTDELQRVFAAYIENFYL